MTYSKELQFKVKDLEKEKDSILKEATKDKQEDLKKYQDFLKKLRVIKEKSLMGKSCTWFDFILINYFLSKDKILLKSQNKAIFRLMKAIATFSNIKGVFHWVRFVFFSIFCMNNRICSFNSSLNSNFYIFKNHLRTCWPFIMSFWFFIFDSFFNILELNLEFFISIFFFVSISLKSIFKRRSSIIRLKIWNLRKSSSICSCIYLIIWCIKFEMLKMLVSWLNIAKVHE